MQNTRNKVGIGALKAAVVDLVALVNQSPLSGRLVRDAKIPLDPALLRVAGLIMRFEPIGVVDLAQRAGRDHTTVSRHVSKLEELGLIQKRQNPDDRRVSQVVLTNKGRRTAEALLATQDKVLAESLAHWTEEDLTDLVRLTRRLVKDLQALALSPDER